MNERKQKLAAKLKENLKRRKVQARALKTDSPAGAERLSLSGKSLAGKNTAGNKQGEKVEREPGENVDKPERAS